MTLISDTNLKKHTDAVRSLDGDFAEIGVLHGLTFKRMTPLAAEQNKTAHGFDSFAGMDDPTELDFGQYARGRLSCGGIGNFIRLMGGTNPSYQLHEGFIPHCFDDVPEDQRYSFALVDVDQYAPTYTALLWVWERMVLGGILVMDDYFKNKEGLAARAIDEWLKTLHPLDFQFIEYTDKQLVIKKQHIDDSLLDERELAIYAASKSSRG